MKPRIFICLKGLCLALALPACTQVAGLGGEYTESNPPCTLGAECTSGLCAGSAESPGWCTALCTSDSDCLAGSCIENTSSLFICYPTCSTSADCADYGGVGLVCQPGTTIAGAAVSVCAPPSS